MSVYSKDFNDLIDTYFKLSAYLQSTNLVEEEFFSRSYQVLYRSMILVEESKKVLLDRQEKLKKLYEESIKIGRDLDLKAISLKRLLQKQTLDKPAEITDLIDVLDEKKVME
jgi:hypothetical protein